MKPLLQVNNLSVSFTQYERGLRRRVITPVADMSLEARPGRITALVGASGSGKTLLGLAVLGLLPANATTSGTVAFDGAPLDPERVARLRGRDLAMLPQAVSHLDPTATVGSQVRRALELAGSPAGTDALRQALASQGLAAEVARAHPHELSGGMARRVLLAMALAGPRRLLIADEPTPGLEPELARATMAQLRTLADDGCAVVLVSHDLPGALAVADEVVVTQAGRTVETALPSQFTGTGEALAHSYSRALWRALPTTEFRATERPDVLRPCATDEVLV